MLVNTTTTTTTATATTNTTNTTNTTTTTTTTKRRRRGQNASTNPGLEEIEVDLDVLRESLKCELCKNLLRDANTVVRLMSFFLKVLVSLDAHSFSSTALLLMGGKTDDIFSRIRTHRRSVCIHFASIA